MSADMNGDFTIASRGAAGVERTYARLAPVYDAIYGWLLQPGRRKAVARMALAPGDRVLEVGVGTGLGLDLYPTHALVTGIDVSRDMLARARARVDEFPSRDHIDLREMDASAMTFPDAAFDVVYAPYVLSVVPAPMAVATEMARVCRPGGRIVLLNRFRSAHALRGRMDDVVSGWAGGLGTRWNLPLEPFLRDVPLRPASIERTNVAGFTTLLICIR